MITASRSDSTFLPLFGGCFRIQDCRGCPGGSRKSRQRLAAPAWDQILTPEMGDGQAGKTTGVLDGNASNPWTLGCSRMWEQQCWHGISNCFIAARPSSICCCRFSAPDEWRDGAMSAWDWGGLGRHSHGHGEALLLLAMMV